MALDIVNLTGEQKNYLHKIIDQPSFSPNFAQTGEKNPHLKVFVVNFDGTQNDSSKVKKGSNQTLAATLAKNIIQDESTESRYYTGVGTGEGYLSSFLDAATGYNCKEKAEEAYRDLVTAAERWRIKDPLVQVHVHVVGFSRGAATGLHFMNMVDRQGIEPVKPGHFAHRQVPKAFMPGTVKTSAVLLDTVSTGQELFLSLSLPPSAISVLHLVAGSEERSLFPVTNLSNEEKLSNSDWSLAKGVQAPYSSTKFGVDGSFLYKRMNQIVIPGARHSDVGDAYGDGQLGKVAAYLASEFQSSLGLPVPQPVKPHFADIQKAFGHDSRYLNDKLRQGLSGVLGLESTRENVKREINQTQASAWNGDMIQTASLSLKKDGETIDIQRVRIQIPHTYGEPFPTKADCSRRHRLEYHPKFEDRPLRFSSRTGLFRIEETPDGTRLLFKGKPIDDSMSENSVFKKVMNGESGFDLHVDISYKKQMAPITDSGQKIKPGETMDLDLMSDRKDPWPDGIQDKLRLLNGYKSRDMTSPALSQMDAVELMSQCMEFASTAIKEEFPDTQTVKIQNRNLSATEMKSSAYFKDQISLSCAGVPGFPQADSVGSKAMFTSSSKATNPRQFTLKARMQDMESALNLVRAELKKEGFDVMNSGDSLHFDVRDAHQKDQVTIQQSPIDGSFFIVDDSDYQDKTREDYRMRMN